MKKLLSVLCSAVMVLSLAACGNSSEGKTSDTGTTEMKTGTQTQAQGESNSESGASGDTVVIENAKYELAAYLPLTGNVQWYGEVIKEGMELAVKDWNEENGGINGREVTITFFDDKSDASECVNVAELICGDKDKYIAAMGSFSSAVGIAAAPVFAEEQLLNFCPTGSHQDYASLNEYTFALAQVSKYENMGNAKAIFETIPQETNKDVKQIGYIYAESDLATDTLICMKYFAEQTGIELYMEPFIAGNSEDYTPILASLFNGRDLDQIVISSDYPTTATIIQQLNGMNIKSDKCITIATGQCASDEFVELLGTQSKDVVVLTSAPMMSDEVLAGSDYYTDTLKQFIEGYRANYTNSPTSFAGQGYDTVMAVLNCVKKYQTTDSEILKEHVGELVDVEPVSGYNLVMDPATKQVSKSTVIYQLKDQKFTNFAVNVSVLAQDEIDKATEICGY